MWSLMGVELTDKNWSFMHTNWTVYSKENVQRKWFINKTSLGVKRNKKYCYYIMKNGKYCFCEQPFG